MGGGNVLVFSVLCVLSPRPCFRGILPARYYLPAGVPRATLCRPIGGHCMPAYHPCTPNGVRIAVLPTHF